MNAAQMLAAAGEPNTKAGREKFHQRFPSKAAFDAWYTPKKEYGGGLTDGIAFPQQPDASSNRAPYYEKGGFFAPNVMPWNGPMGFYEHGGLHKYQDAGQVPPFLGTDPNNYYTERDQAALQGQQNFGNQGFDYEGPITRPGYSFPPAVTPSPYTPYIPGLKLGEDSDRNTNVNIGVGDPRTRKKHPSGGGGSSHHHPSIGKQISRWWDKNFQGRGGGRKYNVASCWNGKCHEYGGMTDGIAFPQQPTDHINFSAFPWQPQYDMGGMNYNMGGLPMNDNGEPCYECGGYMQPGGPVGYKPAPNPDTYFNEQDAALDYPAKGGNRSIDYSKVTQKGPALSQYSTTELNNMGANIPVPNPTQDARFAKIAAYNKEHPYIPAGGNLFKRPDGSADRFNYTNGAYTPYKAPSSQPLVNNRYGGYMQTGGTTEMDQVAYLDNMRQGVTKSIQDFMSSAQPNQQQGFAEEAGMQAAYGTEVNYNQNSDFNSLDMNVANRTSAMENRVGQLKDQQHKAFTDLMNTPANLMANTYLKKPTYKVTQGKPVGMYPTQQAVPQAGSSNNWATTRANMAGQQAASNMFKEYGGDFFQDGGNNVNYQNRVQDILMRGQAAPKFAPSKIQIPGSTQQAPSSTQQTTANTQQYTPEQIAAFQAYMQQMQSQSNYTPSWQAQSKGTMANDPAYLKYLQNMGIQDVKWNNKMGMFGPKSKGHITFRTYYDPKTGTNVSVPSDQKGDSKSNSQSKQQDSKGSGFIKNLIAKNKQRKADKNISKEQKLRMIADSEKTMMPTPDTYQGELAKSQQMPLTGEQRKKQFFDAKLAQDLNNPNYGNRTPTQSNAIPFNPGYQPAPQIGFEYGGFPQYNYGGYSAYDQGGMYNPGDEAEMTDDEIANYLAMGGTLEYLD